MRCEDVKLPEDSFRLALLYILVNERINITWREYTEFVEGTTLPPKTDLIFPIIFAELDFYEGLLARIAFHLPDELLREIKNEEDFSDW